MGRDLDRALASADHDPEDAVTAACSTIESMCRSILLELDQPLPNKKDIGGLYRAVREPLGLSPERSNVSAEIVDDVRKVLSGLATAIEGIGALRTHAGDAHGRERGFRRIDARIARLAIHSASTVALFFLRLGSKSFRRNHSKNTDRIARRFDRGSLSEQRPSRIPHAHLAVPDVAASMASNTWPVCCQILRVETPACAALVASFRGAWLEAGWTSPATTND